MPKGSPITAPIRERIMFSLNTYDEVSRCENPRTLIVAISLCRSVMLIFDRLMSTIMARAAAEAITSQTTRFRLSIMLAILSRVSPVTTTFDTPPAARIREPSLWVSAPSGALQYA